MLSGYITAVVLLAAAARARAPSFEEVYAEVREPVARFALRMLGDPDEAEEVAQEAAVAIWQGLARFEGRSSVTTLALGIVANLAKKRLTRRGRGAQGLEPAALEALAGAEDRSAARLEAEEETVRLRAALLELPERQREALLLATEAGLPYAQIAELLGISVANVKVSVHRARKRLVELLEVSG